MDISVVIPMFNSQRTIERALKSVYIQDYGDSSFEVIVVNDGSTDESLNIVNKFKEKNKYTNLLIINQPNGGVAKARNRGIEKALGTWIALLDADDVWLDNKISTQLKYLNENSSIEFLGSNLVGATMRIIFPKGFGRISLIEMLFKMHPQTSTVIFKKEIINYVGLYNENLRYGEDSDFWIRICSSRNCWFSPDHLVEYDGGKNGFGDSGLSKNLKEMQRGSLYALKTAYKIKSISKLVYSFFYVYYQFKYIRRLAIVAFRKR